MQALWHSEVFDRHYNCSFYDYESIPRDARRNIIPGAFLLVLYGIFELLYLPCLSVFAQKQNRRLSCYRLMLAMGIFSICSIHSSCLIIGLYAVRGDVFCDRPLFNYWIGMLSFGGYTTESILNVMLALDRCMEMWDSQVAHKLFGGCRANFWIGGALVYGLCMGFLTIPPLPNGILVGWFWNPHIPYDMDPEGYFHPQLFAMHNFIIGIGIPFTYAIFYLMMRRKMSIVDEKQQATVELRKSKMNMFMQVFLISLLNVSFAFLYIYMQYFPVAPWMAMFASYAWASSQGFIPVIYITLNKSVRQSLKMNFVDPVTTHFHSNRVQTNSMVVVTKMVTKTGGHINSSSGNNNSKEMGTIKPMA